MALQQAKKPDVIVHIGMPKTGSSALQRFCLNNRKALFRAGFYYPLHAVDSNGVSGGHSVLARTLRSKDERKAGRIFFWMRLKARFFGKTLLLSSEGFARASREFSPVLAGLNVRVVGWFRHPVEYFFSGYNQSVKRGFMTRTLSEQLPAYLRRGGFNQGAKRLFYWADKVGDAQCHFLPYGKAGEPIERQWLRLIGVDEALWGDFVVDAKRINRSYVPQALELKRQLNRVLTREDGLLAKRIDWALQEFSDGSDEPAPGLGRYLDVEAIEQLNRRCAKRNRELTRRFPTLEPILDQSEQYQAESGTDEAARALNLEPVLMHLVRSYPEDIELLVARLEKLAEDPEGDVSSRSEAAQLGELLRVYNGREFQ